MSWLRRIAGGFDRTLGIFALLAAIILILVMVSVSVEVVVRYIVGGSRVWVMEFSEYALLFITFLVAAWLLRQEKHVNIDIVVTRFKPRTQTVVNIITSLLVVLISLGITWFGAKVTWGVFQAHVIYPSIMRPPQWILLVIIPIGGLLLFIQSIRRSYRLFVELSHSPDKG